MTKNVDSDRFVRGVTRMMVRKWVALEETRPIPWTPVMKPLAGATVALVSSAGIALATDRPFDQNGERRNPWWGDPTHRILPRTATSADIRLYHLHVNPRNAELDLNCLFPIGRLNELETSGEIGRAAARHYSTMGYILEPTVLVQETVPAMIRSMREDGVDLVALVPS